MEQCTLKILNNCQNIKLDFYLKTFGGESFNLYLNSVYPFHVIQIRHQRHLTTAIFLYDFLGYLLIWQPSHQQGAQTPNLPSSLTL